ncbi:MAG: ferritin-like domain-containing protein [Gemmatimonadales bacterium]
MEITRQELEALNFYRASELHGGLILGALVRRARDAQLMLDLTRHAAEEVGHAQLWTETILAVGGRPWPTRDTYQARYAAVVGTPLTLLDVLALTQVFERRVYRHFTAHLRRASTHPAVAVTLRRMLEEEKGHLTWVKRWLDGQAGTRPDAVRGAMRRYAAADALVYRSLLAEFGWRQAA